MHPQPVLAEPMQWKPNPGPQWKFLKSSAFEALYGGAAGGGKSDALLMSALRYAVYPSYRALLLRRTFPELQRSLIERSRLWYPGQGGQYNEQAKVWRFPSGGIIEFGHVEYDRDVHNYQSAEYQFIGFDELTTFTERIYTYMITRARSAHGIPVIIRSATNPGGEGHDWVRRRWAPWLDTTPEYSGTRALPGQALSYRNDEEGEVYDPAGTLSRIFIPAKVSDNPHLMRNDPSYVDRLAGLDPVTRAQLLHGDWLAQPAAGAYFKRGWFDIVPGIGKATARRIRYWDRAATEAHKGNDPDYTVGLRVSYDAGIFTVEDMIRLRGGPGVVEAAIKQAARIDPPGTMVGIEQDPGQAGKVEASYYVRELAGYNVRCFPVSASKIVRAQPASAQAERGNIKLTAGAWNVVLLSELEAFPESPHDDITDTLSGAVNALTQNNPARYSESDEGGYRRI